MSLTKVTYSMIQGAPVNVLDFGAVGDGVADDTDAIEAAIAYAQTTGLSDGAIVYFPSGTYLISNTIIMPNRIGLQGANGRGTVIKPHSTFTDLYMFHAVNGTSSMFGSWIRDMYIDARGYNMIAAVWTQAWQETSGMERVLIYIDGTTNFGLWYTDGYGGAAYCKISDCEIFSDTNYITSAGVLVGQVSLVGGFVFEWDGGSIAGTVANPLSSGIRVENDSLLCKLLHCEYVVNMVVMSGVGSLSADSLTGSVNAITNVVSLSSGFTGACNLRNIISNGATGNILDDGATGRDIPASEAAMLAEYTYQPSAFLATLSADILNVTGNSTEYTIIFNTEAYDYLGEYNNATGIFTATRTGKYLFTAVVKADVATGSTTTLLKLVTTARSYEIYRGSVDNSRDSGNNITLTGSVVADMAAGDTAKYTFTVIGIGSDTVDIIAADPGTSVSGQWLAR